MVKTWFLVYFWVAGVNGVGGTGTVTDFETEADCQRAAVRMNQIMGRKPGPTVGRDPLPGGYLLPLTDSAAYCDYKWKKN